MDATTILPEMPLPSGRQEPPLKVAGNRAVVRRLALRQIEKHFIDIAPAPSFGRIVTLDDRMAGGMEMLCRVFVGGIVATADVAASAHIRKCSHALPLFRHSSQPSALGVTSCMPAKW